jgi:ribosomal protein L18
MYKTWLFNNKQKKERKNLIKYGRKCTPRMVIYHQNKDAVLQRIEDETGAKPGAPQMIKHYQATVQKVIAEMTEEELQKARETTQDWSNNSPPADIQAQVAAKKGASYMEHFSSEM